MVNIKLADIPIQMDNRFPDLAYLCAGYETEEEPVIRLSVTQEEIDRERSMQPFEFPEG